MRIIVDEIPKTPGECLFSRFNVEYGYLCTLSPSLHGRKVVTKCSDTKVCQCLCTIHKTEVEKN